MLASKIINIPDQCTADTMCHFFFGNLLDESLTPLAEEFIIDFTRLRFIKPSGVTALANVTEILMQRGCAVKYDTGDTGVYGAKNPKCFLDDAGFFERYLKKRLYPCSACRSTTYPLKSVTHEVYSGWIENDVLPWLDSRLSINTAKQLPEFRVCLDEIINNIKDHSGRDVANVFMQHFPATNEVVISISDFGVGIPHNVRTLKQNLDDKGCIMAAIVEGFSTKSSPRNRGSGLDTLISNVAKNNGGNVTFYSYKGKLTCKNVSGKIMGYPADIPFYPGTLIDITLRTDTIGAVEDAEGEDFTW